MIRTIEIIVAPNGQSRIETRGFTGSDCRLASDYMERALGQRTGEQLTAEFHQSTDTQNSEHNKQY